MRILIATGIYPPQIGGPAKYAKGLAESLTSLGHQVKVLPYRIERSLPFGLKQIFYFVRIFFAAWRRDAIIALDTISVGFPAVVCAFLCGKKMIVRTGGDFLWERYLDRTGIEMPLPDFYKIMPRLSFKEFIFSKIHQFIMDYTDFIVFSTAWQRDIWAGFYNISPEKIRIVENCYYPKRPSTKVASKVYLGSARGTAMKNLAAVREAYLKAKKIVPDIELDMNQYTPEEYEEKMQSCYALIVASLGDISPNSIIEAISYNKPFILTQYNGLSNRLGDAGLIVDPNDVQDMADAMVELSKPDVYQSEVKKIQKITFVHTYKDIAKEFISILKS